MLTEYQKFMKERDRLNKLKTEMIEIEEKYHDDYK